MGDTSPEYELHVLRAERDRLTGEQAAFRAECDAIGVPYDAAGLVRHTRSQHEGAANVYRDNAEALRLALAESRAEVERLTEELAGTDRALSDANDLSMRMEGQRDIFRKRVEDLAAQLRAVAEAQRINAVQILRHRARVAELEAEGRAEEAYSRALGCASLETAHDRLAAALAGDVPPPAETPTKPTTTQAAAMIGTHLADAVRLTREQYEADELGARRWLTLALIEALGLPERAGYPIVDYFERIDWEGLSPVGAEIPPRT